MTKEEMKALVSAKIAGQGNQVDLGSALPELLNAIVDSLPERAPITIDLSGYELSGDPTTVTESIPQGYTPVVGDKVFYNNQTFYLSGLVTSIDDELFITYGITVTEHDMVVGITYDGDDVWAATHFEI